MRLLWDIHVEQHATLTELRTAVFSKDMLNRLVLQIVWDESKPLLIGLCLNPSTATHLINDPTVNRMCVRALRRGCGGFVMLNIFAFRATEPDDMKRAADPVGYGNDEILKAWFTAAAERGWTVMAGWGIHGGFMGRGAAVAALAEACGLQLVCLGATKAGDPRHPLYLPYEEPFRPWPEAA